VKEAPHPAEVRRGILAAVEAEVVQCRACPRLVEWREMAASSKVQRHAHETYWGRPVPGWGDPAARIVVVGLAPGAHGSNRTGRMFTGDRAGDFLHAALHRAGFASQPVSRSVEDGLALRDVFVTAVVRCCPPANRPAPDERDRCVPFLDRELGALGDARVVVALGAFAWEGTLRALAALGHTARPAPRFGHGAEASFGPYRLLGSYHPSQQNTFTGRLTALMLDDVLRRAIELANTTGRVQACRFRAAAAGAAGRVVQVNLSPGGVPKQPVPRAWVGPLGLEGDGHHDRTEHGGPHRAVCLYSTEALARLRAEGHPVGPGSLGENLTLEGIELGDLYPGDRLAVGDRPAPGDRLAVGDRVILEISGPCNPCATIRGSFADHRIGRVSVLAHPRDSRLYARVLEPGNVREGDPVQVLPALPGSLAPTHRLLDHLDAAEHAYAVANWRAALAAGIDLRLIDDGDLAVAATPSVPDANFNMAVGLRALPHLIPDVLAHFRANGVAGWLDVAEPPWTGAAPERFGSVLAAEPARVRQPPRVPGLVIRSIARPVATGHDPGPGQGHGMGSDPDVMLWEAVVVAGFEMDEVTGGAWVRTAPLLALDRRLHLLVAEIDGARVGGAGLFVHRGVGNLGPASVLPAFRGRGIHAALIAARARLAEHLGCTVLATQAAFEGASERNQLRMGFERVWRRGVYRYGPAGERSAEP
jgi:uracil-DNA glycosylase family 4